MLKPFNFSFSASWPKKKIKLIFNELLSEGGEKQLARIIPVVTSNAFAIPEVDSESAIIFDKNADQRIFSESIVNILSNNELGNKLIDSWFEQAKSFLWKWSAKNLLNHSINKILHKQGARHFSAQ